MISGASYTRLDNFKENLAKSPVTRSCVDQINLLTTRYGEDYLQLAERILFQADILGLDSYKLFTKYLVDYLKEMIVFMKTGEYGHTSFNDIRRDVYDNDDVMTNVYMPGLFLAYGFTSILYAKYHLFRTAFTPRLRSDSQGVEVGFGEGFYLWELCRQVPGIKPKGFDISTSALDFATRLVNSSGYTDCRLAWGNIFEGLPIEPGSQDWGILAEVIEHIPEPDKGISEMSRMLKPHGILYVTTVIDSNHMDHIVNFSSVSVVENMLYASGLNILDKVIYKIRDDFPESPDKSIGLAFVCERI